MNVTILCPTKNGTDVLDRWFKCVDLLSPAPTKIVFCENNSEDGTLEKLTKFRKLDDRVEIIRLFTRDGADEEYSYTTIMHVRQLLLTRARQLDPDYALFLDDDIYIVSPDALDVFTTWQVDLLGGAYIRPFPEGMYLASKWFSPRPDKLRLYAKIRKPLGEPAVTSAGCLMVSRKLLQDRHVNFVPPVYHEPSDQYFSEDFGYCWRARERGYTVFLDGIVRLVHAIRNRSRSWDV